MLFYRWMMVNDGSDGGALFSAQKNEGLNTSLDGSSKK